MRTITINGHRPDKFGGYDEIDPYNMAIRHFIDLLTMALRARYYNEGLRLICGGAQGVDQWVMESAITVKIPLTAALPFKGFSQKWPDAAKKQLVYLCDLIDTVHYVSDSEEYSPSLLFNRDKWMVDNSDLLISLCLQDQQNSGTFHAMKYAKDIGVPILICDPLAIKLGKYDDVCHYVDGEDNILNKELRAIKMGHVMKEQDEVQ